MLATPRRHANGWGKLHKLPWISSRTRLISGSHMRWRRHHDYVRPPRPKARVLTADERNKLLGALKAAIERSPILTTFAVQVQCLRNRFFLEWQWSPDDGPDQRSTHGRITPLADPSREFLLEVQRRKNSWSEVATGSPSKLISVVADDTKGTFHGLGSLEKSLRHSGGKRLPVRQNERGAFVYADTDQRCSVQEALYHYFNLPIHVIAQPGGWYSYCRTPRILEFSANKTRVLVRFSATSWSGEAFGGTCLYLNREGRWAAYTIRPNQSDDIATAEKWLVKRKWVPWS